MMVAWIIEEKKLIMIDLYIEVVVTYFSRKNEFDAR
jgi:hypothetical protein